MRVMRIMRIMRVAVGAPMSNNHPNGNSSPEPNHTAAQQTHGVSHGLPRRSPSGRRRAHPFDQTGQTGQTGQTQAPRRRPPHTAVAILPAHPTGTFSPEPKHTAVLQTHGVYNGAPMPLSKIPKNSQKFPKIPKDSHASATPPQHAHPRSHQTAKKCR